MVFMMGCNYRSAIALLKKNCHVKLPQLRIVIKGTTLLQLFCCLNYFQFNLESTCHLYAFSHPFEPFFMTEDYFVLPKAIFFNKYLDLFIFHSNTQSYKLIKQALITHLKYKNQLKPKEKKAWN